MASTLLPIHQSSDSFPFWGELLIIGEGQSLRLTDPVILMGTAGDCQLRLQGKGVASTHCLLLLGPTGPIVRDLGSEAGTWVNHKRIPEDQRKSLQPGDLLTLGNVDVRIEFRMFPAPKLGQVVDTTNALEAEREALRIQGAAVVAQQAETSEWEARLLQRETALARQEEQLAFLLEERRTRLGEQHEVLRQERLRFKEEMAHERDRLAQAQSSLHQVEERLAQTHAEIEQERSRYLELKRQLYRRWHERFHRHHLALAQRESALESGSLQLRRAQEALQQEKERQHQARVRFQGDTWLEQRRLHKEWEQLALDQQRWEQTLNEEAQERKRREAALETRAREVTASEAALARHHRETEKRQAGLQRELAGLENRIRNARSRLAEIEKVRQGVVIPLPTISPAPPVPPSESSANRNFDQREWPMVLRQVASALADQRHHLAEQWHRILEIQTGWIQDRETAQAELETMARHLADREDQLRDRDRQVTQEERDQAERGAALAAHHAALEGWQARVTATSVAWEKERTEVLAQIELREGELADRQATWTEIHKRRTARRRQELTTLRALREEMGSARLRYQRLWAGCQELQLELLAEKRALNARALALERFRQELLTLANNSARGDARIARLERRDRTRLEREERHLAVDRRLLREEAERLGEQAIQLDRRQEELSQLQDELLERFAELETRQATLAQDEESRQRELKHLRALHTAAYRQANQLRDEIDRMANALIEGNEAMPRENKVAA